MMEQQEINRPQQGLDAKETKEVIRIMMKYFEKETGSKEKARKMVGGVANVIKNPAAKLIHIGDTVFLTLVKDKGVVEFHTMSVGEDSVKLAKNFVELTKVLQNMGATKIYSYTDDPRFKPIAKRTRLPWEITEQEGADGKDYTVYTLETK